MDYGKLLPALNRISCLSQRQYESLKPWLEQGLQTMLYISALKKISAYELTTEE